ncbi:hypothetical protein [Reichenbachiella ulvae]|uniref:PQQ-like domain-containing protein n=1 Tax=Reichenbachiella ulvae TaxID=2980104 RepID=A0ABT3CT93_9BACT|nr:hypothetical protein [Reichenbachiella ulvae]MCV9386739.1 hypothetical protein [Reichenbachiella ulvae]
MNRLLMIPILCFLSYYAYSQELISKNGDQARDFALSRDLSHIAIAYQDRIDWIDLSNKKVKSSISNLSGINKVVFSIDQSAFYVASDDGVYLVDIDAETNKLLIPFNEKITALRVADFGVLAIGSQSGKVAFYDIESGENIHEQSLSDIVTAVSYDGLDQSFFISDLSGVVYKIVPLEGKLIWKHQISGACFDLDDNWDYNRLILAGEAGAFVLKNAQSKPLEYELEPKLKWVTSISAGNKQAFAVGFSSGVFRVYSGFGYYQSSIKESITNIELIEYEDASLSVLVQTLSGKLIMVSAKDMKLKT